MLVPVAEDADGFGEGGSIDAVRCPPDDRDEVGLLGADGAHHGVGAVVELFGGVEDPLADLGADPEVVGVPVDDA